MKTEVLHFLVNWTKVRSLVKKNRDLLIRSSELGIFRGFVAKSLILFFLGFGG